MRRWICVLVRWSWNDSCKSRASQSERRLQTSNESGPELSDRARNQANELVFLQLTGLQEIHSTWQWSAGRNFEHTCIARGKKRTPLKAAVVCRSGFKKFLQKRKTEVLRGSSPASRRALKHASAFIADAHVAMWALKSNIAKGFAPTTSQCWEERRKQLAPRHGHAAERSAAASKDKDIKNWGNRWRVLWRFKYGKLRTRERHDIADLRDKALPEGN